MVIQFLLVGIGGFAGAISRFTISKLLNKEQTLPIGTITVNLLGSFLLGIIVGSKSNDIIALLFGTGFLGAFTTFSTLKLESVQLYLNKLKWNFLFYILITYAGGISLACLGYFIGTLI